MIIPFILGFIYFAVKANRVKENIWLYGILCGIGTGIGTAILAFLLKLLDVGRIDETTTIVIGLILTGLAIYVVDSWSGLYWDVERHLAEKGKENEAKPSEKELAILRNIQMQKGEGSLDDLQAYESTLSAENLEESDLEKLELTQNSLPGEIDYIVIPDTIKKSLPENEDGLKTCIAEYKKYIDEEWTESVPMYAAIELDKTGFVFTPEIINQLDSYAKSLKFKNFVELLTYYIPK